MTNEELRKRIERFDLPHDQAISLLQRALERDPDFQLAHRELGWAYCAKNELEEAEHHISRAINLNPTDGWAYIYLGNVRWRQLAYEAAEAAFQQALSLWSESSIPLWCLAMFYDYEKRPRLAGRYYRKALELNPNDTVALLRYGHFLRKQHRNVKAKRILERLLTLEPDSERANSELYEAMLALQLR
jgi:tetratricopeptide (TPR) repeat protein